MPFRNIFQEGTQALRRRVDHRRQTKNFPPLSPTKQQVRVIVLGPGRYNDELRAEMRTIDIGEPHHQPYEAVSHACSATFGSPVPVKVSATRRLLVLPTVATMLRHLRYTDEPRPLWINQLCVNQDDPAEQAAQAVMTTDIFKAARRVVVWLGPEGGDSANAFSLLEDLGWMVEVDFENMRMRPSLAGTDSPTWADPEEELPYDVDGVWSVYSLIYRPWFSRLGSLQEIAAKPDNATIVCGFRTITWDLLRTGLACFASKPRAYLEASEGPVELRFAKRYAMVLLLCQCVKVYGLADLLEQSRKFSCSNPLDRVYSILSLAVDIDPSSAALIPDYATTKEELYLAAAIHHMTYTKTMNILTSCDFDPGSGPGVAATVATMPSWVPDWTKKRPANAMPVHFASSYSEAHFRVEGGAILLAHAVHCGTVDSAVNVIHDLVPLRQVVAAIRRCRPSGVTTSTYPPGICSLLEAYCATLGWGLFEAHQQQHAPTSTSMTVYPDLGDSVEALRRLLALPTNPTTLGNLSRGTADIALMIYATHVANVCRGRSIFATRDGLLGLGPWTTRPGDEVWVLLGCDVPLVLRHATGDDAVSHGYHVIGDCYVHGLMNGEAILGKPTPPTCGSSTEAEDDAAAPGQAVIVVSGGENVHQPSEADEPRIDALRIKLMEEAGMSDAASTSVETLLDPVHLQAAGIAVQEISLV